MNPIDSAADLIAGGFRRLVSGDPDGQPEWVRQLEYGTDTGYFGPGSAPWAVHGSLPTLVGGIRALLVQALHPAALAGVQALVADLGGAWRIAASPSGSIDFVAGARVAATASSAQNAGADGIAAESLASWTALEGEGAPLAGFRSRAEVARGVELSLRGDLSPNIDGGGVAWRVGGGVRVKLGAPDDRDAWNLSVEAGWRTLDAALLRGLPGAGSAGDDQVGAVWVGFSREF